MYKAVIFDLDDTLLNFQDSIQYTQKKVKEFFTREILDWKTFWETHLTYSIDYWNRKRDLQLSSHEIVEFPFRDTIKNLNLNKDLTKKISEVYWDSFCNACMFEPDAKEVIEKLADKFKLGIVSNGLSDSQRQRLKICGVDKHFKSVIISDEVGLYKPDKEIFDLVLSELEIRKEEALFIGDSIEDDYYGAQNAGIDFCYYNRENKDIEFHLRPKYTISSLIELIDFLD